MIAAREVLAVVDRRLLRERERRLAVVVLHVPIRLVSARDAAHDERDDDEEEDNAPDDAQQNDHDVHGVRLEQLFW